MNVREQCTRMRKLREVFLRCERWGCEVGTVYAPPDAKAFRFRVCPYCREDLAAKSGECHFRVQDALEGK